MNTEFVEHVTLAARHASKAAAALVPPGPRRHLHTIANEFRELVAELVTPPHPEGDPAGQPAAGTRRIDIEE